MQYVKPNRPVTKVYLHCSASDHEHHDNVATMRQWHLERGWTDVGYNIFVRKSGEGEPGRSLEKTPAAQRGHNRGSIAICLHGLVKSKFTNAQKRFLINYCHQINDAHDGNVTFHGHNEVSAKECPVIDYKSILKLSPSGELGVPKPKNYKPVSPDYDDLHELEEPEAGFGDLEFPTLRYGNKGGPVQALQNTLNALGYHVGSIDGHFGKRTRGAVLALQADNHLIEDGVVGPATWEAIQDTEKREVSQARKSVTLVGMANDGSRIAQASISNATTGTLFSVGGGLALLEETSGTVSKISESFGPFKETISALGPWVGAAVVLGGIIIVLQSMKAGRARVEDQRTGKTL